MDKIADIVKIASKIYEMVRTVKTNTKRCLRLGKRVNALKELVVVISQQPCGSVTHTVEKALDELVLTLTSTYNFIETYLDSHYILRFIRCKSHLEEFAVLNDQLTESFEILSLGLQAEQRERMEKLFSLANRRHEDEVDRKLDYEMLKRDLLEYKKEVQKAVDALENSTTTRENIRFIKPNELTYDPQRPREKTKTCELFKGEFNKFPVAIKRYLKTVTSPEEVKDNFKREVETMRRFEWPHILRVFGVCIEQKDGGSPVYSIVMEYCKMGTLREVLDNKELVLTLMNKAQMCLGAAHGIYRLHQTEVKPKVHGCLTSSSFMVAKGLIVKLSDFELSQTETSFLRNPQSGEKNPISYCAPEHFTSARTGYNKESEIYSFGVVLWEIITQKTPWENLSEEAVAKKVLEEQAQEEITGDYPPDLKKLICDCRAFKSSDRPTAGAVLDRLRHVVLMLEKNFATALRV